MTLRHRRWTRQANGPLPDPPPKIIKGCCPSYIPHCLSCCNHPNAIYLNKWDWKHRPTLYHELVHWFDYQYLTDADREEIRRHYGWPEMSWWHQTPSDAIDPNCERLARAGTRMYLHPRQYKWLRRKFRAAKEAAC